MTTLDQQLKEAKTKLQAVLEEAINIYQFHSLNIINEKFGMDAGFDERRALASEVAMMYQRAEEMCRANN